MTRQPRQPRQIREAFDRATDPRISEIDHKASDMRARTRQRYAKNREAWVQTEFDRLLKQPQKPELTHKPRGVYYDHISAKMSEADNNVYLRHLGHLSRIGKAGESMIKNGASVRKS